MLTGFRAATALSAAVGSWLALGGLAMAEEYDNPSFQEQPCVIIDAHQSRRDGRGSDATYSSTTRIENVCKMTVEVVFCLSDIDGEEAALCQDATLRPFAELVVAKRDHPTRLTGPRVEWRYLN